MKVQELLNQIRQVVREEIQIAMQTTASPIKEQQVTKKVTIGKSAPPAPVAVKTTNVLMEVLAETQPFSRDEIDPEWRSMHFTTDRVAETDQSVLTEFNTSGIQDNKTRQAIEKALTKDYSSMFKK